MTINKRIELVIDTFRMNVNSFSKHVGVNATVIHNIVKGRNAPGYDLINKISLSFDNIDMNWLINGTGNMLLDDNRSTPGGDIKPTDKQTRKTNSTTTPCRECMVKDELIASLKREIETLSKYNTLLSSK
jgi:plasmid maintenance system antidote protein VapI